MAYWLKSDVAWILNYRLGFTLLNVHSDTSFAFHQDALLWNMLPAVATTPSFFTLADNIFLNHETGFLTSITFSMTVWKFIHESLQMLK